MKKTLFIMTAVLAFISCSSSKNMENSYPRRHMTGAYTSHRNPNVEEKALFEKTYHGEIALTPKKVATQVVAGTNYSFICKDKQKKNYEVVIYQPLPGQGEPQVSSVQPIQK